MLFNSLGYLIFLPAVVLIFWISPKFARVPVLLLASYVFYMSWKPVYGALILALTAANYFFGLAIAGSQEKKKAWLTTAIAANLVTLGIFKYAYFTFDLANGICTPLLGKALPPLPFQIILPLGISFFVFEFIHYVVDVYRGGAPVKSFINFALFASFFPTQIAGPIKRYQDFIPQLSKDVKLDMPSFDKAMTLILFGLFKKVVFADNLAVVVQSCFSRPDLLTSVDMWLAVYTFAFQIYFDFSGYTDIARGSAMLFGYKVPLNFNLPYLSQSISEFWHRWHISLSTWLKDYLFIPLGGSRGGKLLNYRNLLITMVLGGLWHGAALHFVAWGAYQGICLILNKEFKLRTESIAWLKEAKETAWYKFTATIFTFHVVCIGWVFFRADNFAIAGDILKKLFFLDGASSFALTLVNVQNQVVFMILPFIILLLFAGQIISALLQKVDILPKLPQPAKIACVFAVISLLMIFSPDTSPKFIYFQF